MRANKSAKEPTGAEKVKKLSLKKEKLADLSPRRRQAEMVRGQSIGFGYGKANHNESFVRLTPSA